MAALTKSSLLNFDIADYVYYGGYSFIPGNIKPAYHDLEVIADESWKTKHGSIFTINADDYSLEFIYDSNFNYIGDQIEFHIYPSTTFDREQEEQARELSVHEFLKTSAGYACIFDECFRDENELVLFAQSGANVHLKIMTVNNKEVYLLKKITSNSIYNVYARTVIKHNMSREKLQNIRVIVWPKSNRWSDTATTLTTD